MNRAWPGHAASVAAVTALTFREARRRRLVLTVALMGALFLTLFSVGFYLVHRTAQFSVVGARSEVMSFFLLAGLYVVNFLVAMITVLASVDVIAGEISSGTIQTVVTRPIARWTVVLGKWIGIAVMVCIFVAAMSWAMIGIVAAISGYLPPHPFEAISLMMLEGIVLLSLSILFGTRLSSLANGVLVFMLFGLAFIAGWIEQAGAFARNEALVRIGIIVSLVIPSDALWRRAAWLLQPPFFRGLEVSPFTSAVAPSVAMVVYAGIYAAAAVAAATLLFRRRDL